MSKYALILLLIAVLLPLVVLGQEEGSFKIVVHKDVQVESIGKKKLSKIFLRKIKRWDDGSAAEALDLVDDSEVREAFTRSVHRKSISAIKSFWQRMIFSGRDHAPDEMANETELLAKVASTPGAVGYVSVDAELPDGVKVLEITDK